MLMNFLCFKIYWLFLNSEWLFHPCKVLWHNWLIIYKTAAYWVMKTCQCQHISIILCNINKNADFKDDTANLIRKVLDFVKLLTSLWQQILQNSNRQQILPFVFVQVTVLLCSLSRKNLVIIKSNNHNGICPFKSQWWSMKNTSGVCNSITKVLCLKTNTVQSSAFCALPFSSFNRYIQVIIFTASFYWTFYLFPLFLCLFYHEQF